MCKDEIRLLERVAGAGRQMVLSGGDASLFEDLLGDGFVAAGDIVRLEDGVGIVAVFPRVTRKGREALGDRTICGRLRRVGRFLLTPIGSAVNAIVSSLVGYLLAKFLGK